MNVTIDFTTTLDTIADLILKIQAGQMVLNDESLPVFVRVESIRQNLKRHRAIQMYVELLKADEVARLIATAFDENIFEQLDQTKAIELLEDLLTKIQ